MAEPTRPSTKTSKTDKTATPLKARVHCDRCDKESDVDVVAGQTNTGKAFLQGACPHCGAPVYAFPG